MAQFITILHHLTHIPLILYSIQFYFSSNVEHLILLKYLHCYSKIFTNILSLNLLSRCEIHFSVTFITPQCISEYIHTFDGFLFFKVFSGPVSFHKISTVSSLRLGPSSWRKHTRATRFGNLKEGTKNECISRALTSHCWIFTVKWTLLQQTLPARELINLRWTPARGHRTGWVHSSRLVKRNSRWRSRRGKETPV